MECVPRACKPQVTLRPRGDAPTPMNSLTLRTFPAVDAYTLK